jgi:hypothetical protein
MDDGKYCPIYLGAACHREVILSKVTSTQCPIVRVLDGAPVAALLDLHQPDNNGLFPAGVLSARRPDLLKLPDIGIGCLFFSRKRSAGA